MRITGLSQKITLLEMYLLLNHILEVCSDEVKCLRVKSKDIKPGAFTYPDDSEACNRSEGQGLHVQTVQIYRTDGDKCPKNLSFSNSRDNQFMQTLRRACSGRDRCYFVSSLIFVLQNVTCGSKPADSFVLNYVCKPLEPDDNKVFGIKRGFIKTIANPGTHKYYFVLGANETIEHSRCEMCGANVQINVTLLHANFTSIQSLKGKSCLDNTSVNIDLNSQTNSSQQVCLSNGTIELSKVTGLVWIEMSGSQSFNVSCNTSTGSGSGPSTKTSTLSSSTTTATLSLSSTTTALSSSPPTTALSSASSPGDTNNNNSTSGTKGTKDQSSLIQVAVPVSVVLILVILIAVILAVICVRQSPGTTDGTPIERRPADSTQKANEYSHLALYRKEERVTENHYDG